MDEVASSVSATDLLDSYLDKQLTRVSDSLPQNEHVSSPCDKTHPCSSVSGPCMRHHGGEQGLQSFERAEDCMKNIVYVRSFSDQKPAALGTAQQNPPHAMSNSLEKIDDCEKLEDLKSRCQMLRSDLSTPERLEHESMELLRKLEVLKAKCKDVIEWKGYQSIPHAKGSSTNLQALAPDAFEQERPTPQSLTERSTSGHEGRSCDAKQRLFTERPIPQWDKYLSGKWQPERRQSSSSQSDQSVSDMIMQESASHEKQPDMSADTIRKKYPHLFTCTPLTQSPL